MNLWPTSGSETAGSISALLFWRDAKSITVVFCLSRIAILSVGSRRVEMLRNRAKILFAT
jgi:hypothetical protein